MKLLLSSIFMMSVFTYSQSVEEIKVPGLPKSEIRRIARLVDLNEYKRRQGPPGVKITPKAFGKDRRLPITRY
jgi:NAD+ synthase (glutamine-hydrolysing)